MQGAACDHPVPIIARRDRTTCSARCRLRKHRAAKAVSASNGHTLPSCRWCLCPIPSDDLLELLDGAILHQQCAPAWRRLVGPPPEDAAPAVRDYEAIRLRERERGNGANQRRQFFAGIVNAEPIGFDERQILATRHNVAADVAFIVAGFRLLDRDAKERASQVRTTARTRAMLTQPPQLHQRSRRSISRARRSANTALALR